MGKTVSITDIGRKRKLNQDYVFISDIPVGKLSNLYLVADGMGGHNAGGFASRYAVETIVDEISGSREEEAFAILYEAIEEANRRVIEKAAEDESMSGMGTTLVAATVSGDLLKVANVGDSRLYLVGEGIRQVTTDHSLVEEMVRMGGIDREQARNHPDKNIITRAIGAQSEIKPDFFEVKLMPGDRIFMCTDGVSNMLTDDEIFHILQEFEEEEEQIRQIVEAANEQGGRDNMGVILITPDI
ncbi:MAG: Stp1/IreP family PP2C-type Ser/Thr phosphatase [Lachnospiraceae bacterium]|nr:Stp1/IreP family PP2C-type Ser/Thr phosphatase [Lachnospiraceae bacterium]MDD7027312.1 Stp1/IreP family PP2C-type Ser/Thr phosphatase [Lachnospiraceae bacterium]MDY5701675.1 Stp1/IreP family PP2C-type Ser/Thr phosphatase [Lachnospiraceae bacterium]